MLKKILSFTLAVVLAFVFVGCSNNSQKQTNSGEKMDITISLIQSIGMDDQLYDFINEKFNVNLKFQTLSWDSWEQQVTTMISGNDMSDVVQWDLRPWKFSTYERWAKGGVLKPLPEDMSKYPNLNEQLSKISGKDFMKIGGKIYAYPLFRDKYTNNDIMEAQYIYRKDWAEKLGLAKDSYTVDEFVELLKAFRDKDPGQNGKGKTVPCGDVSWAFPSVVNLYSDIHRAYGMKDGNYVWKYTTPEFELGLEKARQMYQDNLIWKDFYTSKDNDGMNLYYANRMGVWYDNVSLNNLNVLRSSFLKANPNTDVYKATSILRLKRADGKYVSEGNDNWWSATLISNKVSDEKQQKILELMEWLASDEGTKYCAYGVKGEDWTEENGKVNLKWPKDEKGNIIEKNMTTKNIRWMVSVCEDINYLDPQIPEQTKKDCLENREFLKKQKDANNLVVLKEESKMEWLSTTNKNKYGYFILDAQGAINKYIVNGNKDEWKKWNSDVSSKVASVLKEINDNK